MNSAEQCASERASVPACLPVCLPACLPVSARTLHLALCLAARPALGGPANRRARSARLGLSSALGNRLARGARLVQSLGLVGDAPPANARAGPPRAC